MNCVSDCNVWWKTEAYIEPVVFRAGVYYWSEVRMISYPLRTDRTMMSVVRQVGWIDCVLITVFYWFGLMPNCPMPVPKVHVYDCAHVCCDTVHGNLDR